jgi:hypothetical protein
MLESAPTTLSHLAKIGPLRKPRIDVGRERIGRGQLQGVRPHSDVLEVAILK